MANTTLQALSGLSRSQLDKARNELSQKGFIRYDKGGGNSAGKYLMVSFDTQTDTQIATQTEHKPRTNGAQAANKPRTLDKHKTKQNETKLEYGEATPLVACATTAAIAPKPEAQTEPSLAVAVQELYNSICVSFPKCTMLSEKRAKAINARFRTGITLSDFEKCFAKAQASDFLKGANNRNWCASFDWLIADGNMPKVLDGNYDNSKNPKPPSSPNPTGFSTSNPFLEICREEGIL